MREAPEDVGGDRAAEVCVQLGEAFHGESLERAHLPTYEDARSGLPRLLHVERGHRVPVLRYGRSWTWHGIRCTSRRTGLTCKNPSGHGFVLSRQLQRVF
ncbi:MAG: DUF6636 domain-containing protein [Gaiellaceae bacterium]